MKNKIRLYKAMHNEMRECRNKGWWFYTCMSLSKVNASMLAHYRDWLVDSPYYDYSSKHNVFVNLDNIDYNGKMSMFKEFLKQYEGEIICDLLT